MVLVSIPLAGRASAQPAGGERTSIDVVQVGGLLDTINVELVRAALRDVERRGTDVVVIQLDSRDATAPVEAVDALALRLSTAPVPVAVWVGPAGNGKARGAAVSLVLAADVAGMAPGAEIGDQGEPVFSSTPAPLADRVVEEEEALRLGVVDIVAPTLADFIGQLDGRQAKGRTLSTAQSRAPFVLRSDLDIRFRKAGLVDRTLHALGSPSATWFLLVMGALLILFELFSAGIGIAAASGVICVALSAYGLGALDARPIGILLLLVALFGFGVDIQVGAPRLWTGVGTVALVASSLVIFDGRRPGWLANALVLVGGLVFVLFGIPSTVRTRFSTPTIGRQELVGAKGTALTRIDPDGTVEVRGAPWRARTFPAAIAQGDAVEVIAIEGMVLEVVPEGTELAPPRH